MPAKVFQPLGSHTEAIQLILASVIVTMVYLALFAWVAWERMETLDQARRALAPDARAETEAAITALGIAPLTVGNRTFPTPKYGEDLIRAYRKQLEEHPVAGSERVVRLLQRRIASRFFGWEQWIGYVLTAWALSILWWHTRTLKRARAYLRSEQHRSERASDLVAALRPRLDQGLAMVRFSIWAVPTIGFIGTVRGMSTALGVADNPDKIPEIVGNLEVAFDTTLVALILSIVLQFFFNRYEQQEDELLGKLHQDEVPEAAV